MDRPLVEFVKALRTAGIAVAPTDTEAAAAAVAAIGYHDRQRFADALAITLAKSGHDKALFRDCFEQFFTRGVSTDDAAADIGDDADHGTHPLLGADVVARRAAIDQAADAIALHNIELFTQKAVYRRRLLERLDWAGLQDAIIQLEERGADAGGRLPALRQLAATLQAEARDVIERHYALYGRPKSQALQEQRLLNTRLPNLDRQQLDQIQHLVLRIARQLRKKYRRRLKVERRGALDLRATLRRNMRHGGTLFQPVLKRRHKDRPQVFVLLDVSGSVSQFSALLLMFVYSLREILPRLKAFAFSARIDEVGDDFACRDLATAVADTLRRLGGGATDYGQALNEFADRIGARLTRNSVVIVLGDARNNRSDPALNRFSEIARRAGSCFWLNPEPRALWDTGDSVMRLYRPHCNAVVEAGTVADLARFCDDLLRHMH